MSELSHYGVLGMKWGIRRYQNRDGSYTSAGRSRYQVRGKKLKLALPPSEKEKAEANKKAKEDVKNTEKIVSESKKLVNEASKVRNEQLEKKRKKKIEELNKSNQKASEMTDKELRDVVQRMNLEQQYSDLMSRKNSAKVQTGKDYVSMVLDAAGSALTVTGSVLSILLAIKNLQT